MSDRSAMPPRRKNWVRGHEQIGLFIRTGDGSTIEITWNDAPKPIRRLAAQMVADRFDLRAVVEKALKAVDEAPTDK
jgi:hypothetical protein